jgi:hypothetical protein
MFLLNGCRDVSCRVFEDGDEALDAGFRLRQPALYGVEKVEPGLAELLDALVLECAVHVVQVDSRHGDSRNGSVRMSIATTPLTERRALCGSHLSCDQGARKHWTMGSEY